MPLALKSRPRIKKNNREKIEAAQDPAGMKSKQKFADLSTAKRETGIEEWYARGGEYCYEWIAEHYRTHSGSKLTWEKPFFKDTLIAIGNPWIQDLWIEKSAQVGWSELAIALLAFMLGRVRIPCGYGVEQESKLTDMVGPRVQPAFDMTAPIQAIKLKYHELLGRKDIDTKQRQITVGGVVVTFFSVGGIQKKATGATGSERQATSGASSFTAFAVIGDEVELWSAKAIGVAKKRQEGCTMPTRPFRAGSTPGHVGGIVDRQMKSAKYLFEWQICCPKCKISQSLTPFGSLLKSELVVNEDGSTEQSYLNKMGKPVSWHYSCKDTDEQAKKIKTAFIGCKECGAKISRRSIESGRFVCVNTGVDLREFNQSLVARQEAVDGTVGLRMPKLAIPNFNPAERIEILLTTENIADELQQGLGVAVSIGGGKISLEKLLDCRYKQPPIAQTEYERFKVIGCDQGKSGHNVVLQEWWLPIRGKDEEVRWSEAFVETLEYQKMTGGFSALARYARKHGVRLIGIDGEPEISLAGSFARKNPPKVRKRQEFSVFLFDQVSLGGGQTIKRMNQDIQGVQTPIYRLHRTAGLDAVRSRIYRDKHRFQPDWQYDPKDSEGIFYQFLTSERLPNGRWHCDDNMPDHYLHAANFAEMCVLADLLEPREPGLCMASYDRAGRNVQMRGNTIDDYED
jgi:Phage terminase large subunit (GpA)